MPPMLLEYARDAYPSKATVIETIVPLRDVAAPSRTAPASASPTPVLSASLSTTFVILKPVSNTPHAASKNAASNAASDQFARMPMSVDAPFFLARARSTSADKWHFRCHQSHELHVRLRWQVCHV